ncbi:MAG: LytR C-terminal domain-containing protein [Actinomycetota bacterium]|nr:LytR C-terminal domain-containing protein [Actinomycetota bacterium]
MNIDHPESIKKEDSARKKLIKKSPRILEASKKNFKDPAFLWKFGFPALLVLVIVWSTFLLFDGFSSVLKSEDGATREAITDPQKEGFEAFVEQTWAEMILTEDTSGELVQVAIISISDRQTGGGTILLVPPELEVENCYEDCTLESLYLKSGLDSVRNSVSALLETEFSEVMTLNPERWVTLVEPLGKVSIKNDQGTQELSPTGVFDFISRESKEDFLIRQINQGKFWRNWIENLVESGDVDAALPIMRIPVVELISTLAKGPYTVVDNLWHEWGSGPEVDPEVLSSLISEMFPFPASTEGDQRATVRLLNGTSDSSLITEMQKLIRENDANITVIGNFRSFNVIQTRVIYKDLKMKTQAERLAVAIGAHVMKDEMVSPVADLTVLIGRDFSR